MANDINVAVRQVLFRNSMDKWPYSHGGTLFVVSVEGRCYGITCWHVLKGRDIDDLLVMPVPNPTIGTYPLPVQTVGRIKGQDSDLQDIAVIAFASEVTPELLGGTAYPLNAETICTSETANKLRVIGYLSEKSKIDYEAKAIIGGFCDLEFTELGATLMDPFLRQAVATYAAPGFNSLDGLSGAPVYDETACRLCGMVARGGLTDNGNATIWYLDICDIFEVATAVHHRQSRITYTKVGTQTNHREPGSPTSA